MLNIMPLGGEVGNRFGEVYLEESTENTEKDTLANNVRNLVRDYNVSKSNKRNVDNNEHILTVPLIIFFRIIVTGEMALEGQGGQEREQDIIGHSEPDSGIDQVNVKHVIINLLKLFNILTFFYRDAR
jgi:hypothetical protein